MAKDNFLAVTAKAKDEVSGPMAAAAKAYAEAGKALDAANQKIVVSEKAKRQAMAEAREAKKAAQQAAEDLRTALGSLAGMAEVLGKKSGLTATQLVGIEVGMHAAGAAARAMIDAVASGISAIIGATAKTIDTSSKFGLKMAEVSSIVDDADQVMGGLHRSVLMLSGEFGKAPTDVAKALYEAVSAGATDAASAVSVLSTANKIAVAGQGDVATTIKALTATVNAFGGSMLETTGIADAMFVAIRDGNITAQEMAEQLGDVVGSARMVGLTFDETAAAVAAITLNGIKASEAVTALNGSLNAVLNPTKKAKEEAAALGIEFSAMGIQKAGGFLNFLKAIRANANLTSESFGRLFEDNRAMRAALALTVNDGAAFTRVMEHMGEKAGAMDAAFARISDTLEFQRMRFDSLREAATIAIGDVFTRSEGAKGALEGVNTALSIFVAEMLGAGVATFGTREEMNKLARETIADLIDGFASLLETGDSISSYFSTLGTAIDIGTTPIQQVVSVFASIPEILGNIDRAIGEFAGEVFIMPPPPPPDGFERAANAARELAKNIREGKLATEDAAKVDNALAETRKKQLEEIEKLYGRLQQRESEGSAETEKTRAIEDKLAEHRRGWAEEERQRAENKRRADAIERQGEQLLLRDALESLKAQEEAAKRTAEAQKQAREEFDKAEAAAIDALEDRQKTAADAIKNVAVGLYGSFRDAFASIIDQSKSFGQAMLDMVKRIGLQIAESLVIRGIGAAIDGALGGLGGGALSWLGKIFGFAQGGVVGPRGEPVRMAGGGILSGGTPGEDSIPVLAMAGEGFLSRDLTSALRRALAVPGPASMPAPSPALAAAGGSMQLIVPVTYSSSVPMNSADTQRHFRDSLIPALRALHAQGHLDFLRPRRG